ncbi:DUF3653 domain-containing protein [Lysobacter tyrosinilyticus]
MVRYLAHPHWKDFIVRGSTLITPEGRHLAAGELGWWSLLVLQAQQHKPPSLHGCTKKLPLS